MVVRFVPHAALFEPHKLKADAPVRRTSWDGFRSICTWEALVRVAYYDDSQHQIPPRYAIGFGSQDPMPQPGDTITVAEAFARMRVHVENTDRQLAKDLEVGITQWQWDAVASLYYQRGTKALNAVVEHFNAGQPFLAVAEFVNWNSGQSGVKTAGHTARRVCEMMIAERGYYGDLSHYKYFDDDPRKTAPVLRPFPPEDEVYGQT
jgi:GH24 family phage-related lysozyme (muramidase)